MYTNIGKRFTCVCQTLKVIYMSDSTVKWYTHYPYISKYYITIKGNKLLINIEIQMNLQCKLTGTEPATEIFASALDILFI